MSKTVLENIDAMFFSIDRILYYIAPPVYIAGITILYTIYISTFLGISLIQDTESYITNIDFFLQILIALYLIIRFMPFRRHEMNKADAMIIFASGVFLLTNLGLKAYLEKFININLKPTVDSVEKPIYINSSS